MIEQIPDLPDNVIGFRADGEVTAEDYESKLIPAVEKMIEDQGSARFLYVLGDKFTGATSGAMWEDTKLGFEHLRGWEKMAVVTDVDWIRHTLHAFSWIVPGKVKVFETDDLADAKAWVAA